MSLRDNTIHTLVRGGTPHFQSLFSGIPRSHTEPWIAVSTLICVSPMRKARI